MSLKVENCRPVCVYSKEENITLEGIRVMLPTAIEILASYGRSPESGGLYMHVILMPYKFALPSTAAYGDTVNYSVHFGAYSETQDDVIPGTQVLAQHVEYIQDYDK